jgi:hypothetical protein
METASILLVFPVVILESGMLECNILLSKQEFIGLCSLVCVGHMTTL